MREALRRFRRAAGLTQRQIADRVGMSLGWYIKVEQDKRPINTDHLRRIAEALNVTPSQILAQDTSVPVTAFVDATRACTLSRFVEGSRQLSAVLAPGATENCEAATIENGVAFGHLGEGTLLYFEPDANEEIDRLVGQLVIAYLRPQRPGMPAYTHLARIERMPDGAGYSLDVSTAVLNDAQIASVAPIAAIVPPWRAGMLLLDDMGPDEDAQRSEAPGRA